MYRDLLKLETFPTIWCPGCGIGLIMTQLAMVMDEMDMNADNTVVVSGIGCTGRMSGYFNLDAVYTLHGRTLPVAEAIKTVNPELNVIVVAGDGDTASIGGNHLLHTVRRNPKITYLCNNNEVYGLTGGHAGPTTPRGTPTLSTPEGSKIRSHQPAEPDARRLQVLLRQDDGVPPDHLRNCIKEAIRWPGFAFVDITSQCIENNGRRLGYNTANDMLNQYRKQYKRAPEGAETLEANQIGIVSKG